MRTLNSAELAFLAVLGHTELTTKVLRVYAAKTYLFTETFHPHLNLMWNTYVALLKKYKKDYGLNLSRDITAAGLAEAVAVDRRIPDELKSRCDAILQKFTAGDIPDLAHGEILVKNLMELDTNRKLVSKLNSNPDMLTLQQSLDASKRTLSILDDDKPQAEETGVVVNPFRDINKLARKVVRVPTGINFLDDLSSGGGREGDLWLILGSPAGGKSTLAVQYSCAQAMLGNNVLWATYEQSIEGDLAERMVANITDTSLDYIRDVGFDNLPKPIQDKFWAAVAGVDDRLTALDMTRLKPDPQDPEDYGGIKSVWKQFTKLKENGSKPKTVIIDWFGAMMSRVASNLSLDLAACYRFKAQEEINTLIQFAKTEKIHIIVFHQLDVKAAGARPTYLADATHSQDMHNLQNFFDLVIILGKKDVNNIMYVSNPKARKGGRIVRTVRMVGEKSRLVMEDGWLPNRDGNFYKPGSMSEGDIRGSAEDYSRELD